MRHSTAASGRPPVIDALTTARNGMIAASAKLGAAATAVAAGGAPSATQTTPTSSPRIGYLPLPADPLDGLTAIMDAELAFKANAAVLKTAADMVEALYKAID